MQDKGGSIDLSEQFGLECSSYDCNGGYASTVYSIYARQGEFYESDYPYRNSDTYYKTTNLSCSTAQGRPELNLERNTSAIRWAKIDRRSSSATKLTVDEIKDWLYRNGTFSFGVYVTFPEWSGYPGDNISITCLPGTYVNHEVQLIGWTDKGQWIFKNSWGTGWGKNGYGIIDMGDCLSDTLVEYAFATFP